VGQRRVEPLGLVLKAGRWYLMAATPRGLRIYAVARITALEPLNETFSGPPGFDLATAWREARA
jgi:predicted DNA-binding transcriptional regulator YafY